MIMRIYRFAPMLFALSLFFAFSLNISAQEEEVIYPYFDFTYLKNNEDQRVLTARIFSADDLGITPLAGLKINFYTNIEVPELIGEALSDEKGYAEFILDNNIDIPVDEDGNWWFYGEFEGNGSVEMTEGEVSVMDVNLTMELIDGGVGSKSAILKAS